jgi:hypothetical protein
MPDWFWGFLTAAVIAMLGWFLARLQRRADKLDEQRQAAAAFRFELESNLGWLNDILESRNYLRDEAWVRMKNEGYVSYLPSPIPLKVIAVYDELHTLNGHIRVLRESQDDDPESEVQRRAEAVREALGNHINELIQLIDVTFPEIGKNFREA